MEEADDEDSTECLVYFSSSSMLSLVSIDYCLNMAILAGRAIANDITQRVSSVNF